MFRNRLAHFALLMSVAVPLGVGVLARPSVSAQEADYTCRFASSQIVIDGKLDEPAWASAEVITKFHVYEPKDAEYLSPTKVRVMWDDTNLYLAFECVDDDVWSFSKEMDSELWNGDVGEFFVKPRTDSLQYYEFVIAPSGAVADARFPGRGAGGFARFKGWSAGATVGTQVAGTDGDHSDTDEGYTLEVAIPLSVFAEDERPAEGTVWHFGAFRYDFSKSFEQPLLMMSIPESLHNGYHYYEGYKPMEFRK